MPTHKRYWGWLLAVLLGLLWGCNSSVDPAVTPQYAVQITRPLSGTLSVEDQAGQVRGRFQPGESIFLVFKAQNTSDTTTRIGYSTRLIGYYRDFVNLGSNSGFLSITQIVPDNSVGVLFRRLFFEVSADSVRRTGWLIPPRTVAEWRLRWQDPVGTQYRWPVFTPATTAITPRIFERISSDPNPLPPGLYRSSFTLDVDDRRAEFSITFEVK